MRHKPWRRPAALLAALLASAGIAVPAAATEPRSAPAEPAPATPAPPAAPSATTAAPATASPTTATPPAAPSEAPPAAGTKADYWGESRFFVATELDFGFLYFRPRLSAGYGRPFSTWLGLDANPLVSTSRAGGYGGVRFKLPIGDLRAGGRFEKAFVRTLLVPQHSYGLQDIELHEGRESHYLSWEAQLTTQLPAGPGSVLVELTGTAVTLVDEGFYVFEETAKIIVDPPWLWRARLGYSWRLLDDRLTVTPVMELAHVPKREMLILRGGLLVSMKLYESLWIRIITVPTLGGRDTIGSEGADTFLAGIRWRWATGLAQTEWGL